MNSFLTVFFCTSFIIASQGQNLLYGKVVDSLTYAPVPFASVFFANTTVGTSTNETGDFVLKNFASGKYDLTVSVLGYKTVQAAFSFPTTNQEIEIRLPQQATQLEEVVVSPDTSHRASDMRQFIRSFIGESRNALDCRVLNTKNIHLYFDPRDKLLIAVSRKPIEIENKALGYKLIYQLQSFTLDYANNTQSYFGVPRFEELTPKGNGQRRRWEKERKRAYEGSFTHLVHLLQKGILTGPFVIQELYRVPNRKRPPEEFLKRKIKYWQSKHIADLGQDNLITEKDDSLRYYIGLQREPVLVDSIGLTFTKPEELLNTSRNAIVYTGMLRVIYKDEGEELAFGQVHHRATQKIQVSVIHLLGKKLTLYENGYYEDVRELFFEGYMGWQEKISDLLPLEYVLPPD